MLTDFRQPSGARISIEPHARNRILTVVADSADFYRSSDVQLDGDRGPRAVEVEFRSLPSSVYEVRGVLFDDEGHERASARKVVTVVSSERP